MAVIQCEVDWITQDQADKLVSLLKQSDGNALVLVTDGGVFTAPIHKPVYVLSYLVQVNDQFRSNMHLATKDAQWELSKEFIEK